MPLLLTACVGFISCFILWKIAHRLSENTGEKEKLETANPFELWPAIKFGILFAIILFVSKAAQQYLGNQGVYISSMLAGIADVDAITLSLSNLAGNTISDEVATRGIMIAALSNTAVKALLVFWLGRPRMIRYALPSFVVIMAAGVIMAYFV